MSLTDKIKGKIGKGLVSLTALAGGIGLAGCETTPAGYAFGAAMVNTAVGSAISGEFDPKGTNVTVNINNSGMSNKRVVDNRGETKTNIGGVYRPEKWDYVFYESTQEDGCIEGIIVQNVRGGKICIYGTVKGVNGAHFIPYKYVTKVIDNEGN